MKKINLADLSLYRGAVAPGERMNDGLTAFYAKLPNWEIRSKCPAGVQLVFDTDSRNLRWSCSFGESENKIYTTDILVNETRFTFDGAGPHTLELPEGENRIVVYFPHLAIVTDYALELDDAARIRAVPADRPKLLLCGDSISQGWISSSPCRSYAVMTAQSLQLDLHNVSVAGTTLLPEIVEHSLEIEADLAVLALGINDIGHNTKLEVFRKRLIKVMTMLSKYAGKTAVITPIPTTLEHLEKQRPQLCQTFREIHRDFPEITLIEGESFFPADPALLVDGLHPNDRGMEVYAAGLIEALRPLCCSD